MDPVFTNGLPLLGAGLLYVNDIFLKFGHWLLDHEKDKNNIRRLSHTGTHPVATDPL